MGEHHLNHYEARAAVRGHSAGRGSHPEDLQPGVATHGVTPGAIVRCRNRDWVLLPGDSPAVHLLRPLTGATDEVVAVHKQLTNLIGYDFPEERVRPATFAG